MIYCCLAVTKPTSKLVGKIRICSKIIEHCLIITRLMICFSPLKISEIPCPLVSAWFSNFFFWRNPLRNRHPCYFVTPHKKPVGKLTLSVDGLKPLTCCFNQLSYAAALNSNLLRKQDRCHGY